ncbi:MAG: carboxypeptidase-like regulatory domain-containing protein [Pyrinomonadaceae bacterium]
MSHIFTKLGGFSSRLIARMLFAAICSILLFSGMSQAAVIPILVTGPTPIGGGQFRYTYRFDLTNDERLDPAATNGATCPSLGMNNVLCDPPGTFVTLYDIPGLISADFIPDATTPAGGNFTVLILNTGITPSTIDPRTIDNSTIANVTYRYNGPIAIGPRSFTGFSIITTGNGINPTGNFSNQATKNTPGFPSDGQTDQITGSVAVPAAPTAAPGVISGRVMTESGRGISRAIVTVLNTGTLQSTSVMTNPFGYFELQDMAVGEFYLISVNHKRYQFANNNQGINLTEDLSTIQFIGQPYFAPSISPPLLENGMSGRVIRP